MTPSNSLPVPKDVAPEDGTTAGENETSADPSLPPVSELALESLELVNCSSGVVEDKEGHILDEEGNILMGSLPARQPPAYVPGQSTIPLWQPPSNMPHLCGLPKIVTIKYLDLFKMVSHYCEFMLIGQVW